MSSITMLSEQAEDVLACRLERSPMCASTSDGCCPATDESLQRVPVDTPPFTVGSLRKAIPAHCFHRSLTVSSAYLAVNLAAIASLFILSTFIQPSSTWSWQACALSWITYWFCQGALLTGVWTIAHECGHQAFCSSQAVNDAVGLALHSLLLVPYYSW